ncbi:uncharacterized protein LOC142356846 [Convolutriloba macropyga]|uniref:uncharacterized protein LOC142356846 n=1 Tax=Convolutriloba macropyga TaxID=536237 RepID=UPI003F52693B
MSSNNSTYVLPVEFAIDNNILNITTTLWHCCYILALFTGFFANLFIFINIFVDRQFKNTNYFFVLNLVVVDISVILGILVVKEVTIALQSASLFLRCLPTACNFIVNFTASNYFLLFLCYEKFVIINLPFFKSSLLSMRVKAIFTVSVYTMTVVVAALKFQTMDPRGDKWCPFQYPIISEWLSDLVDMLLFFSAPVLFQFILYSYTFYSAKKLTAGLNRPLQSTNATGANINNQNNNNNMNPVNNISGGCVGIGGGGSNCQAGYQLTLAQQPSSNQSGQPCGQQVMRPRARQQPQLKIAKTCLVATFVRFLLWLPYVIHLVRLSVRQATGYAPLGDRSRGEMIVDMFLPDLTIIASCTNPIVFITMSPPLKRRLKNLFIGVKKYCCCCCPFLVPCCRHNGRHDSVNATVGVPTATGTQGPLSSTLPPTNNNNHCPYLPTLNGGLDPLKPNTVEHESNNHVISKNNNHDNALEPVEDGPPQSNLTADKGDKDGAYFQSPTEASQNPQPHLCAPPYDSNRSRSITSEHGVEMHSVKEEQRTTDEQEVDEVPPPPPPPPPSSSGLTLTNESVPETKDDMRVSDV